MLFDTHAHYDDERFDEDRDELLTQIHREGVSLILNAGADLASSRRSLALAQQYPFVYAAVGIHPHSAEEWDGNAREEIKKLANDQRVVAIGEIGLDYFYDNAPRDIQRRCLAEQIVLAKELKLPIIIHDRDAHEDCMRTLIEEKAREVGGVFHCFTGSVEMAMEAIKNNFYISLGGPVTFKNARKAVEVARAVPSDRLLIETDCPYLAPAPFRGQRNHSGYVRYVAEKIAEIRGISFEEVAAFTMENARRLFGIL